MTESGSTILVGMLVGLVWFIITKLTADSVAEEARLLEILEFQVIKRDALVEAS